jgi:hypothetical protein
LNNSHMVKLMDTCWGSCGHRPFSSTRLVRNATRTVNVFDLCWNGWLRWWWMDSHHSKCGWGDNRY